MNNTIRILTRDSFLAMAQAIQVSDYLMKKGVKVDIKALKTSGDVKLDAPLYRIAQELSSSGDAAKEGKAFFTKELEDGLLRNEGDLAVHSLKDLPTQLPDGLAFSSAIMPVESTDTIITLQKLPDDTQKQIEILNTLKIATSSLRRISILKRWFPDGELSSVRGNVVTRLEKLLNQSGMNAMILATAGLKRLHAFYKLWAEKRETWQKLLDPEITERIDTDHKRLTAIFNHTQKLYFYEIDPEVFPPAVSQGVLGIESRAEDRVKLSKLFDTDEMLDARIKLERKLLSELEAGCHIPFGNYVRLEKSQTNRYFQISTFYARNFNQDYTPENNLKVDYFTGERLFPLDYNPGQVKTLISEIKGMRYPVIFCGLKNDAFVNYLEKQNFSTYHVPLIKIESAPSAVPLSDSYDVGVVVSKNSVDHFPEKMSEIKQWVSVGEKTGEYLKTRQNISTITTPEINDGISSARVVQELTGNKASNVIWFGALNGKKEGIELLKSNGYHITVYEGYRTVFEDFKLPENKSDMESFLEMPAWWVFTSPSTAQSYLKKNLHRNQHLISVIGKSTAEVFFSANIIPYHIAGKSDVLTMAEEIAGFNSLKKWKINQWSL